MHNPLKEKIKNNYDKILKRLLLQLQQLFNHNNQLTESGADLNAANESGKTRYMKSQSS